VLLYDFAGRLGRRSGTTHGQSKRAWGTPESEAVGSLDYNAILDGICLSDLEVLRGDQGRQGSPEAETVMATAVKIIVKTREYRLDCLR
jgi:hypothetical protein